MIKIIYQTPLSVAVNAGRTCWQSQDKGGCYPIPTNDIVEADKEFLHRILCKHKHQSVAEHIRIVFGSDSNPFTSHSPVEFEFYKFFLTNKFSFLKEIRINGKYYFYISTNLRVLLELKEKYKETFSIETCNVILYNTKKLLGKDFSFLFEGEEK